MHSRVLIRKKDHVLFVVVAVVCLFVCLFVFSPISDFF